MQGVPILLEQVRFRFDEERFCLRVDSLRFEAGEQAAITGPSGCGKTTLLRLIGGMLRPQAGRIEVGREPVSSLPDRERRRFRLARIGLVLQTFELLPYLNGRENLLLPYRVSRELTLDDAVRERAHQLADELGITRLLGALPHQLSQGEKQRFALGRALITRPALILADEPTGSLDPENQDLAVRLLHDQARANGATLLMVTHEPGLVGGFERHVHLPEILSASLPT